MKSKVCRAARGWEASAGGGQLLGRSAPRKVRGSPSISALAICTGSLATGGGEYHSSPKRKENAGEEGSNTEAVLGLPLCQASTQHSTCSILFNPHTSCEWIPLSALISNRRKPRHRDAKQLV